jgi:hypothetical protein
MTKDQNIFGGLDDRPLLDTAKRLAREERRATAALLRALMEIDCRRLYLGEGCASMFAYCTQILHLAEGAAYNRIEAARAARAYPLIFELLEECAITLTGVRLLAPHLTAENHGVVLASARHKSRREIEELVAVLNPRPDSPMEVRKLPASRSLPVPRLLAVPETESPQPAAPVAAPTPARSAETRTKPVSVTPLAPERYRIQLTVSRQTHDKFRRAQTLLSHTVPTGDAAEIFDRALTLLVDSLERRRLAASSRPRLSTGPAKHTRHISAAVRRIVWKRDGGCCAFIGTMGRCRETAFLEFHHLEPYAAGGVCTVANIELRCRAHNLYEARLFFGSDVIREARPSWTPGSSA